MRQPGRHSTQELATWQTKQQIGLIPAHSSVQSELNYMHIEYYGSMTWRLTIELLNKLMPYCMTDTIPFLSTNVFKMKDKLMSTAWFDLIYLIYLTGTMYRSINHKKWKDALYQLISICSPWNAQQHCKTMNIKHNTMQFIIITVLVMHFIH